MQNPIHLDAIQADRLYSQAEMCALVGRSAAWAERCRWSRSGPAYLRVGRTPFYRGNDLRAWIEGTRIDPQAAA
jgi:hypothetical protein